MTANTTPGLQVMDHPLVAHKLTILRRKDTPSHVFRHTLHELSWLLAHPTFAALKTVEDNIETPLEMMTAATMRAPFPCLVSILRAGNGLRAQLEQGLLIFDLHFEKSVAAPNPFPSNSNSTAFLHVAHSLVFLHAP